ncbi:MAG: helix-turn-helix transcriptional regulator [Holophagaceae bacterium]|nr:helix-turn-helix transcriptional regulator [Holophagaceae bacterium]
MGPIDRREREKEKLKKEILDAARYLFARDGYDSVTMRAIAERIEYSPRTIYLHFKDKEDLIRELCQHDYSEFGKGFAKLAAEKDPVQRLKGLGLAYARFAEDFPNHYRLMFMSDSPDYEGKGEEEWKGNPEMDAYAFLLGTAAEAIATGRLHPVYKDAELLAQTMWAGIHGVLALHFSKCHDPWVKWRSLKKRVKTMVDLQVDGLLAEPVKPAKHPKPSLGKKGS